MANSGLGTSNQTFQAAGNNASQSQTNPYGPAIPDIGIAALAAQQIAGNQPNEFENTPQQNNAYSSALQSLQSLPNFGPAAAQTGANYLQTGGDPTGILRRESNQIGFGDPRSAPGMQDVLKTIQNDVSNQVNGQFAGAGRSLSGLNQQTLARGLSQGEAVPLLNQYNQDISNQLGIQGAASGNIQTGLQDASMAPGLAGANYNAINSLTQQQRSNPYQLLGQYENAVNPIAGLGGTVNGTQQTNQQGSGTATNSLLSQLGQVGGLINPFGGLLGTLFG